MSRLVVPYPKGPGLASGATQPPDSLPERVAKYVPVETVGFFVAAKAAVDGISAPENRAPYLLAAAVLCLVASPIYFLAGFKDRARRVRAMHAVVSVFAFAIWAYTLAGATMVPRFYNPIAAALLLPAFSYLVGAGAKLYGRS